VTFLSAEEQVEITGYPKDARLAKVVKFFSQKDQTADQQFLRDNNISFIYLPKEEMREIWYKNLGDYSKVPKEPLDEQHNNLKKFFENSEVVIYEVN